MGITSTIYFLVNIIWQGQFLFEKLHFSYISSIQTYKIIHPNLMITSKMWEFLLLKNWVKETQWELL
jgi:hypothetical protein